MLTQADHMTKTRAALPFSERVGRAELSARARRLVEELGLRADVRVSEGGGAAGLKCERSFRLSWWTTGDDPVRAALQRLKAGVLKRAADEQFEARLTRAWQRAEQTVNSGSWRGHLRRLADGCAPSDAAYLRLAFRAAQQVWSRAARWEALTRGGPSPFAAVLALFSAGAWPLGCRDGVLQVFVWQREGGEEAFVAHAAPRCEQSPGDFVFLSAPFSDRALTSRWERALRAAGWESVHGPVSEFGAAPEAQLGARIRRARAVVGLCAAPDPDFGLPWWMFQELDYARACGRPTYLLCPGETLEACRRRLAELYGASPDGVAAVDEPELRRWLEANAPHLWSAE